MKRFAILALLTVASSAVFADTAAPSTAPAANTPDVTGTYTCQGYDPYGKTNFNSTVNVSKNGDTYSFQWLSNGYPYNLGTGLFHKDVPNAVSVVFWDPKKSDYFGTEVFYIKSDGSLDAQWTLQAQNKIGTESCTKNK